VLSAGRVRLGIGVGGSEPEYQAMGVDFHTRGAMCDEQLELMHQLWTQPSVSFQGRFHTVTDNGIDPRPVQQPVPIWVGAKSVPGDRVVKRIGKWGSGWFVLASPEDYPDVKARIDAAATEAGRNPGEIGTEAGVAVVGPREAEWQERVTNWHKTGLTHLCLRTLGGDLAVNDHIPTMRAAVAELPI
jgi:alkanesulfonate monooxygenase SsuD/methylene tetrahydromethanopterin reductase-like flavin-dependent oxidoreductase (luciferase family)